MKIRSLFSKDKSQIVENALSRSVEESLKIPWSWSGRGWLPKFNEYFPVHRYICDKILTKIRSVVFTRDRQTDKQRALHNLLNEGNDTLWKFLPFGYGPRQIRDYTTIMIRQSSVSSTVQNVRWCENTLYDTKVQIIKLLNKSLAETNKVLDRKVDDHTCVIIYFGPLCMHFRCALNIRKLLLQLRSATCITTPVGGYANNSSYGPAAYYLKPTAAVFQYTLRPGAFCPCISRSPDYDLWLRYRWNMFMIFEL